MVEASNPGGSPVAPVCPWCSAPLSTADADRCPSCGAALHGESEQQQLPGLTAIDAQAIIRAKRAPKPRSRLLSWLSGESDEDVYRPGDAKAVAFPDLDVRREMLKLEIEADLANLQADADAMLSEAAAEGRALRIPPDLAAAAGLKTIVEPPDNEESGAEPAPADAEAEPATADGAFADAEADKPA